MHLEPSIHVFILGDLAVLRADGTSILDHEWRTGKNRDLLRLLALENGQRVRAASLAEKLWPDVGPERSGASLRTAISHLRRLLGPQCIVRRDAGVVLEHAWVDVGAFEARAAQVHAACRDGDFELALELTEEAEALYAGEFRASDDDSDWATQVRSTLSEKGYLLLVDVAEAALELGRHHDALPRARRAMAIDRLGERAQRALMRALAGLGEVGSALRVFETSRAALVAELGISPSAETRELYLSLLRDGARPDG